MLEENIQNLTKSDSSFSPTFVNPHALPDISFNGPCLIKNNFSIPWESNKFIYFLYTKSMVKKIKHRFYIK